MEYFVGGLILLQGYTVFMASKDRRTLLNAVMAKTTSEFVMLQKQDAPKRKKRDKPLQDDAGIPYGL